MKIHPHLLICEHCDSVYEHVTLERREVARCQRCLGVLFRAGIGLDSWAALTLAAAIAWCIANLCPIVHISLQGMHNDATLWQAALALGQGAAAPIAIPAALFIIVVPAVQVGLVGWLLVFALTGRRAPAHILSLRVLAAIRPWSMVEVCMLGILVSVIKLSSLVQIVPGPGIWATAALMLLLPFVARREMGALWSLA